MRTTITIDDALYEQALSLAEPGMDKPADIVREAIKTYVRVQAGRRLANLGGSVSEMQDIPPTSRAACGVMSVLVDASVWVAYFRHRHDALTESD